MQSRVLNHHIIIEPEKQGKRVVFNAYCPTPRGTLRKLISQTELTEEQKI